MSPYLPSTLFPIFNGDRCKGGLEKRRAIYPKPCPICHGLSDQEGGVMYFHSHRAHRAHRAHRVELMPSATQ